MSSISSGLGCSTFNFCSFASYSQSRCLDLEPLLLRCAFHHRVTITVGLRPSPPCSAFLPIVNHQTSHVDAILRSFIVCLTCRELISQNPSTVKYCAPMASVYTRQPRKPLRTRTRITSCCTIIHERETSSARLCLYSLERSYCFQRNSPESSSSNSASIRLLVVVLHQCPWQLTP